MKKTMTIRQAINFNKLSDDDKLLMTSGIITERGNLTKVGQRVVVDFVFSDKDVRQAIVDAVKALEQE